MSYVYIWHSLYFISNDMINLRNHSEYYVEDNIFFEKDDTVIDTELASAIVISIS